MTLEECKKYCSTYSSNTLLFYPEDEKDISCYTEFRNFTMYQEPASLRVDLAAKTLRFILPNKKSIVNVSNVEDVVESIVMRDPEVTILVAYLRFESLDSAPVVSKVFKLVGCKLTSAESFLEKLEHEFVLKYHIKFSFKEWSTLDPVLYSKGSNV